MITRIVLLVMAGVLAFATPLWAATIDPVEVYLQVYAGPDVTIEGTTQGWWSHAHDKDYGSEWGWYQWGHTGDGPVKGNENILFVPDIWTEDEDGNIVFVPDTFAERQAIMGMGVGASLTSDEILIDFTTGLSTEYRYQKTPYNPDPGYASGSSFANIWAIMYVNSPVEITVTSALNGPVDQWSSFDYYLYFLGEETYSYGDGSKTYYLEPGLHNLFFYFDASIELVDGYSLLDGQVTLEYREVPMVPIPGAVWLFGSGLLGLVRIRKKFRMFDC